MINEDKVRTMAETAAFKDKNEKDLRIADGFFESDYVTKHMLIGFFAYTICFVAVIALLVIYNSQELMNIFDIQEALDIGKKYFVLYIALLVIYELLVLITCKIKYSKAEKNMRIFHALMKRIAKKQES